MPLKTFILSAFGDEIANDMEEQLKVIKKLEISYLDIRGAWEKNVLQFDDDDVATTSRLCNKYDLKVGCIGSPIGKVPITIPIEQEISNLKRIFKIAEGVGTRRVRIFSFYPPDTKHNMRYDLYVKEATERLARMANLAEREGFYLSLENEKEVVGDIPERCYYILHDINNPHLRFTWDPANFVQSGVSRVTERAWSILGQYVNTVHVKDALLVDGTVKAAGAGDGQVKDFLAKLLGKGFNGFLSMEHHLGMSPDNMIYAVKTLRKITAELGCVESKTFKGD